MRYFYCVLYNGVKSLTNGVLKHGMDYLSPKSIIIPLLVKKEQALRTWFGSFFKSGSVGYKTRTERQAARINYRLTAESLREEENLDYKWNQLGAAWTTAVGFTSPWITGWVWGKLAGHLIALR